MQMVSCSFESDFKLTDYCEVDVWTTLKAGKNREVALEDSSAEPLRGIVLLEKNGGVLGPIVEDPVILGRMALISALSCLNAFGIARCDTAQIQILKEDKMKDKQVLNNLIMKGFEEATQSLCIPRSFVSTHQSMNFGVKGIVSIVTNFDQKIRRDTVKPDDVLVLTKPLGTGVVLSAYELFHDPVKGQKIRSIISKAEMQKAYQIAVKTMTATNMKAADLMRKFESHGAVYISRLGILGHAEEWISMLKDTCLFYIQNLPVIHKTAALDKMLKKTYNLSEGYAPEVCGGLLICFEQKQAAKFCAEFNTNGDHAWVVATVHDDQKGAIISNKRRIIEVDSL